MMAIQDAVAWRRCPLGDAITLHRGYDLPERDRRPGEVPIVSSSGVTGYHDAARVVGPGVVTGRYGTLGEVFYIEKDFWPLNTTLFVSDFKGNNPRYIGYMLRTLNFGSQNAAGAVPGVNRNHLHLLPIALPPLPTQRKIAAILSAYDDLIENTTHRIALLEELARALYREWFVEYRYPGHAAVPLVDSPLGLIPQGWRVMKLGEIAHEVRHGINPDEVAPETPYIGLEHLPRRSIAINEWGRAQDVQSTKLVFHAGDILFGKIRPYFHKVAVAPVDGVCSSDAIVIKPKIPEQFALTLACVSSDDFVQRAVQTSQGTKMPRANWDILTQYPIAYPPSDVLERFSQTMEEMVASILNMIVSNRNLRRTRDLLLPRLVSGEMDAEDLDIEARDV